MMNKVKYICGALAMMAIIGASIFFTTHGASFERTVKNFQSEYSGGLNRTVIVYSMTGEEIGRWQGKIDLEANENKVLFDLNGKRTIIYNAVVIVQED